MSEEQNIEQEAPAVETPNIDALVEKAVEERLAKIKGNLDSAYAQRDEALKQAEALKKSQQDSEIKHLEEQGRATEALEARLKQQEEAMAKLMEQNTALSRDTAVREQLAALEFSGEKAARMAANDITGLLKRNEDGSWTGHAGESIHDVISSYAQDEGNSFLFKQKISQGASSVPTGNTQAANPQSTKSLADMSVEEAIAAAARGDLDGKTRWY